MKQTDSGVKSTNESGITEEQSAKIADQEAQRIDDALGDAPPNEIKIEWFGGRSFHKIKVEYNTEYGDCSSVYEGHIINTVFKSSAAVLLDSTHNGESALSFIPSQFAAERHFAQAGDSA